MAIKVLIVEDDAEFCDLLQMTLEQEGCIAFAASSAMAALRSLGDPARRPDVLVVDVGLPDRDMDGLDLCRALKRDPATRRLPVVVLTARTDNATRVRAAACQADLVLAKPIEGHELMRGIQTIVDDRPLDARGMLQREDLELDPRRGTVVWRGRTIADLGPRLFDLLYLLVENSPQPLTGRRILSALRLSVQDSEVYVLVSRLRARLRRELGVDPIETVPNRGYRFQPAHAPLAG